MDKIGKIKLSMAKLGWNIEERISDDGWGDSIGYRIWFKRWDWHGKETLTLIGNKVRFTGATSDAFDYEAVLNIVYKTAKKARKAWHDFPRDVPCTNTGGEVVPERLLVPWERGRDVDR